MHILDEHLSLKQTLHDQGSMHVGYDQFVGCLPAPVGTALTELLYMIPSTVTEGRSYLYDLWVEEG